MSNYADIRNVAVIAHVDHGKTTLVDAMLKQTHTFRDNQVEMSQERIMDSNELEKEKGITILAKNTSVYYKQIKINIIDTPGHADFGGEVERVLNMADGALLIVDAAEGPLSQTKFVLKRAMDYGLKVVVVINKIDRKDANPKRVLAEIEDMFLSMTENVNYLKFPVVYSIGRKGVAFRDLPADTETGGDITPLLQTIIDFVPSSIVDVDKPFKMMVSAFEKNTFLGKLAMGRIYQGRIKTGDKVWLIKPNGEEVGSYKVEKMYVNEGVSKVEVESAESGEIVFISGIDKIEIGQTICSADDKTVLREIDIAPPTLKASFGPNSSLFAKKEGRFLTSRELKNRLLEEVEVDLGLRVEADTTDSIRMVVSGRGELHLAILIEKLRREGYALEVGKPEVILKKTEHGLEEPYSELVILSPSQYLGVISAELGKRKAVLKEIVENGDFGLKLVYRITDKNALGLRSKLMAETKGQVSINMLFLGYQPLGQEVDKKRNGALIASETGKALSYGLNLAQKRGITFVYPTEEVYQGQIIGVRPIEGDLEMNICKGKQLTNMRSAGNDEAIILAPAVKYSIEEGLDFIDSDEYIDVTPKQVRLRKKTLDKSERERLAKKR